jgi:hypothetical protein
MAGLSSDDVSTAFADIDYAVFRQPPAARSDLRDRHLARHLRQLRGRRRLRVQRNGGTVTCYKKRAAVHQRGELVRCGVVDTSLNHVGATVSGDGARRRQLLEHAVNVTLSPDGQDLTKIGTKGWNAGAVSGDSIIGDGYVEFSTDESNRGKAAGLSNGDSTQSYQDIDFMFMMGQTGALSIYENKINRGSFGTYAAGDTSIAGGFGGGR